MVCRFALAAGCRLRGRGWRIDSVGSCLFFLELVHAADDGAECRGVAPVLEEAEVVSSRPEFAAKLFLSVGVACELSLELPSERMSAPLSPAAALPARPPRPRTGSRQARDTGPAVQPTSPGTPPAAPRRYQCRPAALPP